MKRLLEVPAHCCDNIVSFLRLNYFSPKSLKYHGMVRTYDYRITKYIDPISRELVSYILVECEEEFWSIVELKYSEYITDWDSH